MWGCQVRPKERPTRHEDPKCCSAIAARGGTHRVFGQRRHSEGSGGRSGEVGQGLAHREGRSATRFDHCPGDLTGKEGTTMRCTLTAGADTLNVKLTVTSVEGDTVKYDIAVEEG
ncbi:DUF4333 domain-containing protein [Nocardia asiatica]|uniref:DUF4333 domain-containing protein n=1 Tax=Nocardia asiatica TaxID=209252 RepID=UPI003EE0E639